MKVLSLWEPWATLMALGEKRIETRGWRTRYRGLLAIHASKGGWTMGQVQEYCKQPVFRDALACRKLYPGHIIAIVNLIDCCPMEDTVCLPGVFSDYPELDTPKERYFGDYSPGRWAWVTEDVFRLPEPVPYKGAQGLRDVPVQVSQAIDQMRRPFQELCPGCPPVGYPTDRTRCVYCPRLTQAPHAAHTGGAA